MLCVDILRTISTYLLVRESLCMEVAFRTRLYDMVEYKHRLRYEVYDMKYDTFFIRAFFDKHFWCDVRTKNNHLCRVSIYHAKSTREACEKTLELFKIRMIE